MINFSSFTKCKTEQDFIKEKYLNQDIFKTGTKIITGEKIGEIIRRGPNYVICLDENKNVFRSWITNIKEYVEEKPKKINKYRNYNYTRNNMNSVQSTAIFLGMLPEHSYKIRRAVERTILERMDYDTAVETISEDLKSSFLVNKAIEYYNTILSEAANPQMDAAKKQMQQRAEKQKLELKRQQSEFQQKAMRDRLANKQKEAQDKMKKQASKAAQMKEEEELDELKITGNLQSYQKPGKRAKVRELVKKIKSNNSQKKSVAWFREDEDIDEAAPINTRMAKRSKESGAALQQMARGGSRLAKQILRQRGLGEEEIQEKKGPCWKNYEMVGTKMKNGREVPNCVPEEAVDEALIGKQHKIDANKNNKIDSNDLAILRAKAKAKKESFSNWRKEVNLSDDLLEKISGNVVLNPDTRDCPDCGNKMDEANNTCPHCDVNNLRTKYREESALTSSEKKKKEKYVKSMKKKAGEFEKRYPGRGKSVMYATATKMAKEEYEELDEAQDRYAVFDKVKNMVYQSGMSEASAKSLYQRLIKSGRSSKEIAIRKIKKR